MADSSDSTGSAAAAAGISALGNYAVSVAANKRQWKYQQQAMELQQNYNKDLWDYQNAYNTPQAQMGRLQAAGLNPRLIYGNGSASTGNADSIAPTDVPVRQATRAEIPDVVMRKLQVRQMDAQYAATTQATENAKRYGALQELQESLKNLQLMKEGELSKYYPKLAQSANDLSKWSALRSKQLYYNEQTKGMVMDQLQGLRAKQMTGLDLDNEFKQNRNELAKYGIYQSDHPAMRIIMATSRRMGIDVGQLITEYGSYIKSLIK